MYKNCSDTAYTYAYDDNGNITSITKGTTSVTYQYNGANELTREDNAFNNIPSTNEAVHDMASFYFCEPIRTSQHDTKNLS